MRFKPSPSRASDFGRKKKSILYVLDADVLAAENYADDIETKGVTRTLKARHPDLRGAAELALFPPAHGGYGAAERKGSAGLNFDERNGSLGPVSGFTCRDEVNVTMPILEPPLRDLPAVDREPPLRDFLAFEAHRLPRC